MTSLPLPGWGAALLTCLWLAPAAAAPPEGRTVHGVVTKVTDGDSLWVTPPAQREVEVRLRDIDAPEICQVWGEEARRALAEWVLGKTVVLRFTGRDQHGRTLGYVQVDDVDVGLKMVEQGHAWSARTKWDRGPLVKQERMAIALGRGLHGLPGAVMPRDFRQAHGPCVAGLAADRPVPAATPAAPIVPAAPPRHREAVGTPGGLPMRRPHALFADDLVRRGPLLPEQLPRRADGRRPRRRALRDAVVSLTALPRRQRYFTRTQRSSIVSFGHCTALTFFAMAQVRVRRYSGM